jgi:hypothetical protein
MASVEAAPKEGTNGVVTRVEGSIAELFGGVQMPCKVLVKCSFDDEMQQGEQQVHALALRLHACDYPRCKQPARCMSPVCSRGCMGSVGGSM